MACSVHVWAHRKTISCIDPWVSLVHPEGYTMHILWSTIAQLFFLTTKYLDCQTCYLDAIVRLEMSTKSLHFAHLSIL